ncbi:hypothetical protein [Enterococcus bulliens]
MTKTNDKAKTGAIVGQTVTYTLTANNLASFAAEIKYITTLASLNTTSSDAEKQAVKKKIQQNCLT